MQDEPMRRVVLIGATGFFGRRLADRLATIPQIALVVTSRDEARARHAAEAILVSHASASVISLAFERDDPESLERLRALSPWLVIDASGPFQSADYRLARAVLDMGAHWIDLADARELAIPDADVGENPRVAHAIQHSAIADDHVVFGPTDACLPVERLA